MIGKRLQQIISGFLCLALTLSMFISPAYAWDASAGGDGDFGEVGSQGGQRKLLSFSVVLDKETDIPQSRGVKLKIERGEHDGDEQYRHCAELLYGQERTAA